MTTQEFSDQFDILFNNVTSNQAPGINEYEKSVFLTKALNQLVTEYFNSRVDQAGGGFDGSLRRQYDFSSLIKTTLLLPANINDYTLVDKRSICYLFPYDYFLSVNELLVDSKYQYTVTPLDYNLYSRLMMKPYAFPVKKGAWRLISGRKNSYTSNNDAYFLQSLTPTSLSITYVRLPNYEAGTRWYDSPSGDDINGSYGNIYDEGSDRYFLDISGNDGGDAVIRDSNFLHIRYNDRPFKILIKHEDNYSAYYLYLYELVDAEADIPILTDAEVANILRLAFTSLLNHTVTGTDPLSHNNFNINVGDSLKDFYDRFGTLSTLSVPELKYNFKKTWNLFTGVPGDEILDNNGNTVGHVPWGAAYTFALDKKDSVPIVEIIGRFNTPITYTLRYIKKLQPIILVDLRDVNYEDVSIGGINTKSECELPEETHQEILERAVTLAKIAWQGGTMTQAAAESNSRRNNNND